MKSINPNILVLGFLLNFAFVRLAALFLPNEYYFSFTAFLFDNTSLVRPAALFGKLVIPTIAGFVVVALLAYVRSFERGTLGTRSKVQGVLENQAAISMAFAAAILATMMAWPYIILWDMLIDPRYSQQRFLYLIAYSAYIAASAFFALAGANTASALFAPRNDEDARPLTLSTLKDHPAIKPVWDALSGIAAASLAAFLGAQVS